MTVPLVLTIDLGTQSIRAMLTDPTGNILRIHRKKFTPPYFSLHPGWAEQQADVYLSALCEVTQGLKDASAALWNDIIAVTLTTIRDSCVCVDAEGHALRDVILWLDKRDCTPNTPVPFFARQAFRLVGMEKSIDLQRSVSVCNWIARNEPSLWARTDKFLMLSGFLTCFLTGRIVDSSANMIGHIPYDSKVRGWMKKGDMRRCIFDIPESKLCDLVDPGDTMGSITARAAEATGIPVGLPVIATGSDKGCETLGLGCISPERAAIGLGTTATVQLTTDTYMEPLPFIPAYPAVLRGYFNPEVQIYRGYWLVSWFKNEFAQKEVADAERYNVTAEELLNQRLRDVPAGCLGLTFQPYFTPGVVMPEARGAIIGFSDAHTRIHIYRAIIEGIGFALLDGLRTMEKRGRFHVQELYVGGGGSQSNEICQITADLFGLPVNRIQTHEASGLGSAIVAFAAMGAYDSVQDAVRGMVHTRDTFLPSPETHAVYDKLYREIFTKIFGRLLPLYKKNRL